ncbi:MAG: Asp-tRNA(Asn)/Glu-tRNA(Gln) amidotransferase subunit GatB [Myxococcota bacterium]
MESTAYEMVIGLECHVQLLTESKLFSPARNRYGDAPNENVDVVDAGLPGVLPVMNEKALRCALFLGLAAGCTIRRHSTFARKHYFYPDLPKGYQISQYDEPLCEGGEVLIDTGAGARSIALTRIHIEEDAGKSMHEGDERASFVDYNRAGTPLLEVVTEPVLRGADEAMAFVKALRALVVTLGICDGNMQEGSLRVDANVSVRKRGSPTLGQRTELKNLNSIRFLGAAIEVEAERQIFELEQGRNIVMETRLYDEQKRQTRAMRSKEEAHDYRYFPEPDLLPLHISEDDIAEARAALPELPLERERRYGEQLGLSPADARTLVAEKMIAEYFEDALAFHSNPRSVANWVVNEVMRVARSERIDDGAGLKMPFPARSLAELVRLVDDGTITGRIAKQIFSAMVEGRGTDPARLVTELGLQVERDEGALVTVIEQLITEFPKEVQSYRGGKAKALGFFVGQVMRRTEGKADPAEVNRLLKERLGEPGAE